MGYARLQAAAFDIAQVHADLHDAAAGGVASYVGTVRAQDEGRQVQALHYEAYGPMAEAELERLRREAVERFGLVDAIIIHRVGRILAGEASVVVAVSAAHRKEAFAAQAWLMERIKETVPVWKKEEAAEGRAWLVGGQRRVVP